ncbi:MAG: hypothetical protein II622_06085, partial [Thermoguttaceae bacterium]|nr:hypothetical protein [Thermoguttaceae bacterium]
GSLCSEAHYDAALKIAQDGIVLLQNKRNVLPIDVSKARRVLVFKVSKTKKSGGAGVMENRRLARRILFLLNRPLILRFSSRINRGVERLAPTSGARFE